ncbi:MAG: hypothetical protein AB7U81_03930, partial [Thiohalomonadaceae bacterium]
VYSRRPIGKRSTRTQFEHGTTGGRLLGLESGKPKERPMPVTIFHYLGIVAVILLLLLVLE